MQAMRSSAKYIWIFIVILFVGGFLLVQTSGLLGRAPVTTSTAVAKVNGEEILATTWFNATQRLEQQSTPQTARPPSLDDLHQLSHQALESPASHTLHR